MSKDFTPASASSTTPGPVGITVEYKGLAVDLGRLHDERLKPGR